MILGWNHHLTCSISHSADKVLENEAWWRGFEVGLCWISSGSWEYLNKSIQFRNNSYTQGTFKQNSQWHNEWFHHAQKAEQAMYIEWKGKSKFSKVHRYQISCPRYYLVDSASTILASRLPCHVSVIYDLGICYETRIQTLSEQEQQVWRLSIPFIACYLSLKV